MNKIELQLNAKNAVLEKELQKRENELRIQATLEKVREVAMSMKDRADMLRICRTIAEQMKYLGVKEIRNVQTAIIYEQKGTYVNYEFYAKHRKELITEVEYTNHPMSNAFIRQMLRGPNEFFRKSLKGKKVKDWYRFQKTTNQFADKYLAEADSLTYYWYSLGPVALGISTYKPLSKADRELFLRFRNVFDLSYRRFLEIERAEARAEEARIDASLERMRAVAMGMRKSEDLSSFCESMFNELTKLGFLNLRNVQVAIENDARQSYTFYVFSDHEKIIGQEAGYKSSPLVQLIYSKLGKSGDAFYERKFSKRKMNEWRRWRNSLSPLADPREEMAESMCFYLYAIGKGHLGISTFNEISEEQKALVKRCKSVFELSYSRFADLQKAESQAREAQIEAALERVRSRAMAMHASGELKEVAHELRIQLGLLGQKELETCAIHLYDESPDYFEAWAASRPADKNGKIVQIQARFPKKGVKIIEEAIALYESGQKDYVLTNIGTRVKEFMNLLKKFAPDAYKVIAKSAGNRNIHEVWSYWAIADFSGGSMVMATTVLPSDMERELLRRFANVFGLAYRRFTDLKKAEEQSREAQIELALERVRARTMAMHNSQELAEVAGLLFEQVKHLGVETYASGFNIWDNDHKNLISWMSNPTGSVNPPFEMPIFEYDQHRRIYESWKKREAFIEDDIRGERLIKHYQFLRSFPLLDAAFTRSEKAGIKTPERQVHNNAHFTHGYLLFITPEPRPAFHEIFIRFAKVFDQTYTRFLDLQKAEAQARESQIQLALERVRARTMAMQRSDELSETVYILFQQFKQLGENPDQATIGIINEAERIIEYWVTLYGKQMDRVFKFSIDEPHVTSKIYKAWKEHKKSLVIDLSGKELSEFSAYRESMGGARVNELEKRRIINVAIFSRGLINVQSNESRSEESIRLLERFAGVFDQTYTRFLDLQMAEAQARESQIQLALERVRARTMAMQKSDELTEVAGLLFEQVKDLGIKTWTTGFNVWSEDNNSFVDYITSPKGNIIKPYTVQLSASPFGIELANARKRGDEFWVNYGEGEILKKTYQALTTAAGGNEFKKMLDDGIQFPSHQYNHFVFGSRVSLMFITYEAVPEAHEIFKRFGKVFEQTYTRFIDLKKAEAQAREAQVETALERVRSRTLAMQQSDELAETASVLFKQLILLGIETNRLFITIIRDETGEAEFWITDEDGAKISAAYTANLKENLSFAKMFDGWKKHQQSLVIDMHGEELENYFHHLTQLNVPFKGGLSHKRRIQYIAYFNKGFIGMASPDEQPAETMQLLERFAYAFNLTFTRFSDLKTAEAHAIQAEQDLVEIKAARQRAEDALKELQITQRQLIQSEKMASLGELTAGIAHEIQNPLNFVNNFSQINKELIDEAYKAMNNGNPNEVVELLSTISKNEDKIIHHGQRADSIVKGMMQHSREPSGQKEPTEINALADEYLRLCYQGLRAKDKAFNATIKTDFDPGLGKIDIIPQEIGRVLLNLYNNAFYAVSEMKKHVPDGYEPTVSVSTKRVNGKVELSVKDNGNGIPQ
ncbi:MAG: sensor histidine kinase [Chitinophagales bacterium]